MYYIFKLDICINKKTKQNKTNWPNLEAEEKSCFRYVESSYLQGPVPKMWMNHTATHALKLLTELKEYTDMKKNTNNRHKRSWSVCISPMCFRCIEYFNSSIMTNGYYYINKVCQVCSSISKGNKLSAIFFIDL